MFLNIFLLKSLLIPCLISVQILNIFFLIFFISYSNLYKIKLYSLFSSLFLFFLSGFLFLFYNKFFFDFQFCYYLNWFIFYNINISFGLDGFSIFFIILTTFLTPLCLLISWNSIKISVKLFYILMLFLEFFLFIFFSSLDLFIFYIFFEIILIPMFFIIGIWGSRDRKFMQFINFYYILYLVLFLCY